MYNPAALSLCICIYIYPSKSTLYTSIVQLLPVLRWHVQQLRAPLRRNPQWICAHKHFNALGCIHIFAGITYCSVGGLHGFCQLHCDSTHVAQTPFHCFLGGVCIKVCPLNSLLGGSHSSCPMLSLAPAPRPVPDVLPVLTVRHLKVL